MFFGIFSQLIQDMPMDGVRLMADSRPSRCRMDRPVPCLVRTRSGGPGWATHDAVQPANPSVCP